MFTLWWSELDSQVHNLDKSHFLLELQATCQSDLLVTNNWNASSYADILDHVF